ncbi:MAG: methyltransferase domain-containing protein [Chromatiaceae bacterium]|nr:methyltransferase domain-containing protein [Gammaproteobacteria bacterium]MCP5306711.1 methyltransferase domain-containing protein [Chromatiaceae bacterium]MCP5421787.1 methyltransferase domain-containing protein [Chromatiaceae bacterium]
MCAMAFSLAWRSEHARHTDQLVARKLNLWRDILPYELEPELMDQPVDHVATHAYPPGELIVPYQADLCFNLSQRAFHRRLRKNNYIEPRMGRFYPRAFIGGSRGVFPEEILPFRVCSASEDMICCDLNNPLADRPLELTARILDIWAARDEHGGSCNDIAEMVTLNGPGMQGRWRGRPTDFWQDIPFARIAGEPDAGFYALPRMVSHIDRSASAQIARLYRRLLPRAGRVLDLMASWESHLPRESELGEVVGLGMNAEELAANPLFASHLVHDLNLNPTLPFGDGEFDAVICSLSVEYLVKPFEVFAEVARVLRPGGRFVVSFSNRWFPPKAIHAWEGMHEFERPGLVLEYFLRDGLFDALETWSIRGLPRPADDKYADRLGDSDPVYAVWGSCR